MDGLMSECSLLCRCRFITHLFAFIMHIGNRGQARIQGGKGALPPPPSPQKIAPPNSQARIQGGQEGLGPPLQNPGSAYVEGNSVCV